MNNYLFFCFTVKKYVQSFSFEHKKSKIKEKIIELQEKKKILSDNLIEGKESSMLSSLSESEIKSLLSYSDE